MHHSTTSVYVIAAALTAALCILNTSALPTHQQAREASGTQADGASVQDLTANAFKSFLASKNVADKGFVASTGWTTISWLGDTESADANQFPNKTLFETLDTVSRNNSNNKVLSSDAYRNFIQDMNKGSNGTGSSKELEEVQDTQTKECGELYSVLTEAMDAYRKSPDGGPVDSITDSDFTGWASIQYAPYRTANAKCMAAKNKYNAIYDKLNGNNFALFSQAVQNIQKIMDSQYNEGFDMPIDKPKKNGKFSEFRPLYSMYGLQGVLNGYKDKGSDDPAFAYDSSKDTSETSSESTFGGAHLGFSWSKATVDASASSTKTDNVTKTTAQSFQISFVGLTLADIDLGLWWDGWRSASAIKETSSSDNVTDEAKEAFQHYFGSADDPGPASVINAKALIAYKPTIKVTFSKQEDANHFQSVAASANVCFLFICGGGSGGSSKSSTSFEKDASTITIKDNNEFGYVVGFVQRSFFDGGSDKGSSGGDGEGDE